MIRVIYRAVHPERRKNPDTPRPDWFDYKKCFRSILKTYKEEVKYYCLFDTEDQLTTTSYHDIFRGNAELHYINSRITTEMMDVDPEKAAGYIMYNWMQNQDWSPEDIVYIVEDDYLHLPSWSMSLADVFNNLIKTADVYVSLYDHPDKYSMRYQGLQSTIVHSKLLHWRTVPSTCGTFAAKYSTFMKDIDIHKNHLGDHNKFVELENKYRTIISAIPAQATHCLANHLSPTINWRAYNV